MYSMSSVTDNISNLIWSQPWLLTNRHSVDLFIRKGVVRGRIEIGEFGFSLCQLDFRWDKSKPIFKHVTSLEYYSQIGGSGEQDWSLYDHCFFYDESRAVTMG